MKDYLEKILSWFAHGQSSSLGDRTSMPISVGSIHINGDCNSRQRKPLQHWLTLLEGFGLLEGDARIYLQTHLNRYEKTLALIASKCQPEFRILELGGSFPFCFSLMLKDAFPEAQIILSQFDPDFKQRDLILKNQKTGNFISFNVHSFNIEKDDWPFPENSFDLVLCMEIIEHLLLDPCHLFREAHRVLRPAGEFIVTTPNIASLESVSKLMDLKSPYSFGIYSKHGIYGRHNREYTPFELSLLGESSSFDTRILTTDNIYPTASSLERLPSWTSYLKHDNLRGQNIFYVGVKIDRDFDKYPVELFDFDPDVHSAFICIDYITSNIFVSEPIKGRVTIENKGTYIWENLGDTRTRLRVMLANHEGTLIARDFRKIDLPGAVLPKQRITFDFEIEGQHDSGSYILRFDMVHEQVCWFSDLHPNLTDIPINVKPANPEDS